MCIRDRYKSTTDCGETGSIAAPGVDETAKWEQLSSGYSPSIDSDTSTLTISEDMWKYYVKAEFVPNSDIGYGGTNIQLVNSAYIRKIYNEQITITSDTKDGNGNNTAYSGPKMCIRDRSVCVCTAAISRQYPAYGPVGEMGTARRRGHHLCSIEGQ